MYSLGEGKMKSDANIDIKAFLDSDSYAAVFDTNVFLNLYRIAPDYADFLLSCLDTIKEHIFVPKTVQIEFLKHNKTLFGKRKKTIESLIVKNIDLVKKQKDTIIKNCSVLQKSKFSEVDNLIQSIREKYEAVEKMMEDYFDEHNDLTVICDTWTSDRPADFIKQLESKGHVLPSPDYAMLYRICDDGQNRYKKFIPPGYKDEKDKDGLRKYCDLIWWKEVLNYAESNKKHIILVTDDIKEDWWKKEGDDFIFREELLNEFYRATKYAGADEGVKNAKHLTLVPFISESFFKALSTSYGIEQPETIDYALAITSDSYIDSIEDMVFYRVVDKLVYSNDDYLKLETMTRVGSEGVEEWEIEDHEFVEYNLLGRDGNKLYYSLKYKVTMSGNSYDYWGRDDDTKDVILSNAFHHTVVGIITVEVSRTVDLLMDFNDNEYDTCEIVEGVFEEKAYSEEGEEDFDGWYGQGVCPRCGRPLTFDTDALNGFCIKCSKESDDI